MMVPPLLLPPMVDPNPPRLRTRKRMRPQLRQLWIERTIFFNDYLRLMPVLSQIVLNDKDLRVMSLICLTQQSRQFFLKHIVYDLTSEASLRMSAQ